MNRARRWTWWVVVVAALSLSAAGASHGATADTAASAQPDTSALTPGDAIPAPVETLGGGFS